MIDILSAFPHCSENNCLEIETDDFLIIDTERGKCEVCKSKEEPAHPFVSIINESKKPISFLAIDECILFSKDGKKCDCAVFDESRFCFIEIKKSAAKKKRKERKSAAILQLKNTLEIFSNKLPDISKQKLEALLCVGYVKTHPATKSSMLYHSKEFVDNYNATLTEGNQILFQ